jgi:putative glycosyltransferase (TIGR04348 family)
MRIGIVTPAPPGSSYGNRITAIRWARILRKLGYRVSISQQYDDEKLDLLIALHSRRSYPSVSRFRRKHPESPIILALTGTDVYRDIHISRRAQRSLQLADRLIVLQPGALRELDPSTRRKTRVIYQSAENIPAQQRSGRKSERAASRSFDVCVIGHLRTVKDPFRAALAARLLPQPSRIRVMHIGAAMTKEMERRARREERLNPRYRWLGELSRAKALRRLAQSQLCIISSRMEGGANVLSEAISLSVPVIASRIDGNVGILGSGYPGLFPVGGTRELANLMQQAESNPHFLRELRKRVRQMARLFDPAREENAWMELMGEIATGSRIY